MNRLALPLAVLAALVAAPSAIGQNGSEATQPASFGKPGKQQDAKERDGKANKAKAPAPAKARIALKGLDKGKVDVGGRVLGVGYVRPFVPNQEVRVWVARAKNELVAKKTKIKRVPGKNQGRFKIRSKRLIQNGAYRVRAQKSASPNQEGFQAESKKTSVRYPDLDPGNRNNQVRLFTGLLRKQGFYTSTGRSYNSAVGRAVLAFRKTNNMSRTMNATPGIFETLAAGRGGFKLKYPGAGKHVEADLSRQVMVLAAHGKPQHTFHISSGTAATPTIQGKHTFFRKEYGTNSLGMVHSVYFGPTNRGYATHGYKSVPNYPASHGCLRNPIPNSRFIYNWINLGETIYVYP